MPKALPHFTTTEINFMLENGEFLDKFVEMLEEKIVEAEAASDGECAVQFFISYEPEEDEEGADAEDDPDLRREDNEAQKADHDNKLLREGD